MKVALSHIRRLPLVTAGQMLAEGRVVGDWLELPERWLLQQQAEAALVGADRQRWEAAGRPVYDQAHYAARKAICGACVDQVCAGCRRTEVYRWLPTQSCPLGFWPASAPLQES